LDQEQEPGLCSGALRGGLGCRRRITLGEHQRRRAEPRIGPIHLSLGQPTIAVNFIATRVPNRATRPYLPRSSSALVMRRQSPANLSRQMATGFGCDECRVGTVVGIRSDRVKEARGWRRSSEGAKSTVGRRGQGGEPPGRLRPGALHLDRHKEDHPEGGRR
jgi:hypothetical protein